MTGLVTFLAADALGVLSSAWLIGEAIMARGPRPAVRAGAVAAGSLLVFNLVTWRMGLGWAGQLPAFVLSAAVVYLGRAPILAIVHYPSRVTREGEDGG